MFPDSKIAQQFKCRRTKLTQILKKSIAPELTKVIERCKTGPYSVMIDESNDHNGEKTLVILVRLFEDDDAASRILDMPVCNIGTNEVVFDTVAEWLNVV
ncbi:UNVERIFIED_CONTAM: hypothetical protein FKN15_029258 [Acipenser sinensis]